MIRVLALVVCLAFAGCTTINLEVGAGKNDRFNWTGKPAHGQPWIDHGGVGAYIGVVGERVLNERLATMCYYKHFSQWDVGRPFDDRKEDNLDTYGCGVKIRLFGKE